MEVWPTMKLETRQKYKIKDIAQLVAPALIYQSVAK